MTSCIGSTTRVTHLISSRVIGLRAFNKLTLKEIFRLVNLTHQRVFIGATVGTSVGADGQRRRAGLNKRRAGARHVDRASGEPMPTFSFPVTSHRPIRRSVSRLLGSRIAHIGGYIGRIRREAISIATTDRSPRHRRSRVSDSCARCILFRAVHPRKKGPQTPSRRSLRRSFKLTDYRPLAPLTGSG